MVGGASKTEQITIGGTYLITNNGKREYVKVTQIDEARTFLGKKKVHIQNIFPEGQEIKNFDYKTFVDIINKKETDNINNTLDVMSSYNINNDHLLELMVKLNVEEKNYVSITRGYSSSNDWIYEENRLSDFTLIKFNESYKLTQDNIIYRLIQGKKITYLQILYYGSTKEGVSTFWKKIEGLRGKYNKAEDDSLEQATTEMLSYIYSDYKTEITKLIFYYESIQDYKKELDKFLEFCPIETVKLENRKNQELVDRPLLSNTVVITESVKNELKIGENTVTFTDNDIEEAYLFIKKKLEGIDEDIKGIDKDIEKAKAKEKKPKPNGSSKPGPIGPNINKMYFRTRAHWP